MFFTVLAKKKGPMGDEHKSNSFKKSERLSAFLEVRVQDLGYAVNKM